LPPLLYINVIDNLQMIAGVAGGLTAAFIYIFFFVRWTSADVVGRVRELLSRMGRVKKGDLEAYASVRSGDEIGELGEGFNAMLDGLRERERIEGMNKRFASGIIITAETYGRLGGDDRALCEWRYMPELSIRGKREPVDVYAALGGDEKNGAGQRSGR
jgi:class 3 adenylate cyclase